MYRFKVLLFCILCIASIVTVYALPDSYFIRINSIAVMPVMPADFHKWNEIPDGLVLTAQLNEGREPQPVRAVIQIKQGDRIICGNAITNALSVAPFTQREFTFSDFKEGLLSCPSLEKGEYSVCIQFFNNKNEAVSAEVCMSFMVNNADDTETLYSAPEIISPGNNTFFTVNDVRDPITFSWTTVKPLPQEPITYRLQVWQLKEGQTGKQAMEINSPIFQKDIVEKTQITLLDVLSEQCSPPNINRYIWTVQALNSKGMAFGSNGGYSKPASLVVSDYIIRIDSLKMICTAKPGVYTFSYTLSNINAGAAKLTNFVVTSSIPTAAVVTTFTPPLNTTIPAGSSLTVTGTVTGAPSLSNICIGAEITDVVNSFWKASRDSCIKVLPCVCDACDARKVSINITPTTNIIINANNTLTLNQPLTIVTTPVKLVKSIKAELQYFEFVPESDDCMPCNKDSKTYGNLDNGSLTGAIGTSGGGTHTLLWNFSPPKNFAGTNNAAITITLPPTVKCCSATIRWCIRYVITFSDCTVCNKLVCYEKKKDGCSTGISNPYNN